MLQILDTGEIKHKQDNYFVYYPKKEVISFELPITIIIKVENGKVVEHRDFADYQAYLSQYQKEMARLRAKASGGGR